MYKYTYIVIIKARKQEQEHRKTTAPLLDLTENIKWRAQDQ